ncbi:Fc.00g068800.m01.CDS01 [Cosmosporella sp. VM-42]
MRLASPATDRHREDAESQHPDEGFHTIAHDPKPEPQSEYSILPDAPMTDAPATAVIASNTTAPATTASNDDDIEIENQVDAEDPHETVSSTFDNIELDPSAHVTIRPSAQGLENNWGFIGSFVQFENESYLHPQPVENELDMSDSEGGAPLDEDVDTIIHDHPLLYSHYHDFDPLTLDPNGQVPGPTSPEPLHSLVSQFSFFEQALDQAIMEENIEPPPGLWVPVPNQPNIVQPLQPVPPMFDPVLDDPLLVSNPNPMMLGSENLGLIDLLRVWAQTAYHAHHRSPMSPIRENVPHMPSIREQALRQIDEVQYANLQGDSCDMQGMDWAAMGTTREEARARRYKTYRNYVNKDGSDKVTPLLDDIKIPSTDNFFRFKSMHIRQDIRLAHFQLRSVLACPSRNQAYYAASRGINRVNPVSKKTDLALSMSEFTGLGAMISTLDAKHGVLMAGTFNGEYCLKNLESEDKKNFSDGQITSDPSGITNHIQIHLPRKGGPVAAISSNDDGFRVMDLTTEKLLLETGFPFALNCSSISPDRRLRVMVGDNSNVLIVNSETGQVQQRLGGHRDYGFACDWADDGWTVATAFQDRGIKIWDARYWCDSSGNSTPLCTIRSEMAGVRSLRFSPEGSGRKILVAAEEADNINIIDAQTFTTKQTIDIFGEIGGVAFTNDGQDLNVLCCDRHRGGLLQLDRVGARAEPFYDDSWRRRPSQFGWCNERDNMLHIDEPYIRRPTMMDSLPFI